MSTRYVFDYFPLVVMHVGAVADDEFDVERMLEQHTALLARRAKFANVVYAGAVTNAAERARIAQWERQHQPLLNEYYLGSGVVLRSVFARGALTALRWLNPAPKPERITDSPLEAVTFCLQLLEDAHAPDIGRARRYLTTLADPAAKV